MTNPPAPTKAAWSPSRGEIAIFLLAIVVIVSDMPEPIPFWPMAWGQAPSVGTVLLITAILLALSRFGREQWDKAQ
jgi:hypothetical protein